MNAEKKNEEFFLQIELCKTKKKKEMHLGVK